MADMTGSRFLGGCIGLAVLGTILYGLGFASPFWFDYQMNNRRVYGGLFIVCDPDGLQRECYSIYNSFSEFTEGQYNFQCAIPFLLNRFCFKSFCTRTTISVVHFA